MSLAYLVRQRCAICGSTKSVTVSGGYSNHGASELDTRPAGSRYSGINSWITCCDRCHYCAPDLEADPGPAKKLLTLPEYQQQFSMQALPEKARHFLCHAMLSKAQGQLEQSIWACIHAAWVCDDEGSAGENCRVLALELIEELEASGAYLSDNSDSHCAIVVDLLRRSCQFGRAQTKAEEGLAVLNRRHPILDILRFQLILIERYDFGSHSLNEISFSVLTHCRNCGHPIDCRSEHCSCCGTKIEVPS